MKPPLFSVVYADPDLVVFDKKSGLLVAADRYDETATRLDTLAAEQFGRILAVHRIDKDTSGLVIYARTPESHRGLSLQFQMREVEKIYQALICGRLPRDEVVVNAPLAADGDGRHRTVVNIRQGKEAHTVLRQTAIFGNYAWIEARITTGRTHQIRAHLAHLGVNIVADPLYGDGKPLLLSRLKRSYRGDPFDERPLIARLALHAGHLALRHPVLEGALTFDAPLHRDMAAAKKQLEKLYG